MIQKSLFEYLITVTDLTDEVQQKIYPFGSVPTKTDFPYITWQIIDNIHVHNQGGASGLANPRLQTDIWSATEYEAARIMDILRKALDMFRGPMGESPDQTEVRLIAIDSDNEQYTPPGDMTQQGAYRATADFLIWFVEGV